MKTLSQTLDSLSEKYAAVGLENDICEKCGFEMTPGFGGYLRCRPCEIARAERDQAEREATAINYRMGHLHEALGRVGVPVRHRRCSRSNWTGHWPSNAKITDGITVIHGPVGSGKTHLGTAMFAEWFIEHGTGLWFDVVEFVEQLRNDISSDTPSDVLKIALETSLLMLDDLGAERLTDFTLDRVAYVLRHRYDWMLPTIITTNLTPSKVNEIDPRLMSRMFSGTVVARTGKDYRFAREGQ
jgi:hypothetical protein